MRLGRRPAVDERDWEYRKPRGSITRLRSASSQRYWWDLTWRGDQRNTSQCVAYSALHRIENSPRTYPQAGPIVDPGVWYRRAQEIDEWPGSDYDGTSVRAGAKVAQEHKLISSYAWCFSLDEVIAAVLMQGPVIVGTQWWYSMFSPRRVKSADGDYRWTMVIDENEGGIAGGHAYLVNGVNVGARVFRVCNSWGTLWGVEGRASVSFETMERLLFAEDGEACVYQEVAS